MWWSVAVVATRECTQSVLNFVGPHFEFWNLANLICLKWLVLPFLAGLGKVYWSSSTEVRVKISTWQILHTWTFLFAQFGSILFCLIIDKLCMYSQKGHIDIHLIDKLFHHFYSEVEKVMILKPINGVLGWFWFQVVSVNRQDKCGSWYGWKTTNILVSCIHMVDGQHNSNHTIACSYPTNIRLEVLHNLLLLSNCQAGLISKAYSLVISHCFPI